MQKNKTKDIKKIIDRKLKILEILFNSFIIINLLIIFVLNERVFEGVILVIAYLLLRYCYPTTYHCNSILHCAFWTLTMFIIGIKLVLPINITLFGGVLVAILLTYALWFIQDKKELYELNEVYSKQIDDLLQKVNKYEKLDIYKMTENELRQYGASKQLSEIQQDILCMRVLEHLKISEICDYRNYGRTTIKYHLSEIKKKLEIDYI